MADEENAENTSASTIEASKINLRDSEGNLIPLPQWTIGDFIANVAYGNFSGDGSGGGSSLIQDGWTLKISVKDPSNPTLYLLNESTGDVVPVGIDNTSTEKPVINPETGEPMIDPETGLPITETVSYTFDIDSTDPDNPVLKIKDKNGHEWVVGQSGLTGNNSETNITYSFVIDNSDPNNPIVKIVSSDGVEYPIGAAGMNGTNEDADVQYNLVIDDSDPNNPILKISNGTTTFVVGVNGLEGNKKYDPQTGEEIIVHYKFIIDDSVNPPVLKIADENGNQFPTGVCKVEVSATEPDPDNVVFWVKP